MTYLNPWLVYGFLAIASVADLIANKQYNVFANKFLLKIHYKNRQTKTALR